MLPHYEQCSTGLFLGCILHVMSTLYTSENVNYTVNHAEQVKQFKLHVLSTDCPYQTLTVTDHLLLRPILSYHCLIVFYQ